MAGSTKASLQEIVAVLLKWRGNVKAAAEELGMRRKNLYERLAAAKLKPEAFRSSGASVASFRDTTRVARVPRNMSGDPGVGKGGGERVSSSGPYKSGNGGSTVSRMQSMATPEPPFEAPHAKPKGARLRPEHQDDIRAARIRYIAEFEQEMDEQTLLDRYMEGFAEWAKTWGGRVPRGKRGGGTS